VTYRAPTRSLSANADANSKSPLKSSSAGFGAFHRERAALSRTGVAWPYFYGFEFS
jgi:hypothetical protein